MINLFHSATGKDIVLHEYCQSDKKLSPTNKRHTLTFHAKGIEGKGDKLLVFGSQSCAILRSETLNIDLEEFIIGFTGDISHVKWLNSDLVGIETSLGLFIYNIKNKTRGLQLCLGFHFTTH